MSKTTADKYTEQLTFFGTAFEDAAAVDLAVSILLSKKYIVPCLAVDDVLTRQETMPP